MGVLPDCCSMVVIIGISCRLSLVIALHTPQKSKQTVMIGGSPAEAAKELVKRLREEARVL